MAYNEAEVMTVVVAVTQRPPGPGPGVASAGTEDAIFTLIRDILIYNEHKSRSLLVYRLVHAPVILTGRAKAGFDSPTERHTFCFYCEVLLARNVSEGACFPLTVHDNYIFYTTTIDKTPGRMLARTTEI